MPYAGKKIREAAGYSVLDFAQALGVDSSTVCNWESGRRQISIEKLEQAAEFLQVSIDFLLDQDIPDNRIQCLEPVTPQTLLALHQSPVWLMGRGWALVDAEQRLLRMSDGATMAIAEVSNMAIHAFPPAFTAGMPAVAEPLDVDEIPELIKVWVEPISADTKLRDELRGWYRPYNSRLVENEFGNRWYFDSYGSKWLAFAKHMETASDRYTAEQDE